MYNTLAYLVNERSLKQTNKIRHLKSNINERERERERNHIPVKINCQIR